MDGVASSGMRHWKCPCNLLRQPAALQQRHQYFRLMGRLEIYELLLSLTHNGIYTIIFFFAASKKNYMGHPWHRHRKAETEEKEKKKTCHHRQKKKSKHSFFIHKKSQHRYSSSECKILQLYECLWVFVCVWEKGRESVCVCVCVNIISRLLSDP